MNNIEMLHSRYAQALFEYMKEKGLLDETKKAYELLCKILDAHPQYKKIFISPYLSRKEKKEAISRLKEMLNLRDEFLFFLKVLIEENRFDIIHGVYLKYIDLYLAKKGVVSARLYSAGPMSEDIMRRIKSVLDKKLKKNIRMENVIDTQIIGGLRLEIKDEEMDASIKRKLNDLKEHIYT